MAESERLELQLVELVERAVHGLDEASAGLRKLFAGVSPEVDRKLEELAAVLGVIHVKMAATKPNQKDFAPHCRMLQEVFAEMERAIRGLASESSAAAASATHQQSEAPHAS
jgi:hypothetical protein